VNILFDANIYIDIACRPDTQLASVNLFKKLIRSPGIIISLANCSYTDIYYVISKLTDKKIALDFFKVIEDLGVQFLDFTEKEILFAKTLKFTDHEDACVCASAVLNNCALIITRDVKGFKNSPIKVRNPGQFLREL
jgi:hypothetical protein